MAIASTSHFSKNVDWDQVVQPGLTSVVYRNNEFLPLLPFKTQPGGSAYEWRVNTAGNTSAEVFSEGGASPTAVAQTVVMATLSFIYFRATVRVTGHLRDAIRGQAVPDQYNVILNEYMLAAEDIRDLMNTTFLGASNNGLLLAVDSAGTYANIDRSSVTGWASYENALAASHANMMTLRTAVRDNDYGGRITHYLCPWTEVQAIQNFAGAPGAANNSVRFDYTASGGQQQLAPMLDGTRFGEGLVVGIGDMTDDTCVATNISEMAYVEHRSLTERPDTAGDDDLSEISMAGTLVHHNTRHAGKLTSF